MAIKIGINGFGRIGRLFYRQAVRHGGFEIVAVNDLVDNDNLAYLLEYDTMHGRFEHAVRLVDDRFEVAGQKTRCLSERDPARLPWKELGVSYVLESTGFFTKHDDAKKHLDAGAERVLLSAPTKTPDQVRTFCYKVNHDEYDPSRDRILSNASCTTNCLAPIAKVVDDTFGLDEGLMKTVHSVTATQPTQDGPTKKDFRGGRNAYMNIIPSSTGAAKAVGLCIPSLQGKLTGMALRVPVADVSVVDLTFRTTKKTSLAEIQSAMQHAAGGPMEGVLEYTSDPIVSSDLIGNTHSSIYDAGAGIELNDRFFKIVSWYDNEMGYATRCVDMLEMMADQDGVATATRRAVSV
ncbi:MAG: type I glyceraldehyde-3-phosphate dehydrogenase [Phycisphaerae bacterium]|nr:type I glyceraldehyde-3-phosphate dehydrogenase [Phycisphaerae bacterium]